MAEEPSTELLDEIGAFESISLEEAIPIRGTPCAARSSESVETGDVFNITHQASVESPLDLLRDAVQRVEEVQTRQADQHVNGSAH